MLAVLRRTCLPLFATFVLLAAPAAAQSAAGAFVTGTFVVLRGTDTVAVETFRRGPQTLTGQLLLRVGAPVTESYQAVIDSVGTMPFVEVAVYRNQDTVRTSPSVRTRVIFRDDSVAVDALTTTGLKTQLFRTERGALPYLNLSFALLEQAVRRAAVIGGAEVTVPFFNLNGAGQTAMGTVARGPGGTALRLGSVAIELELAADGGITRARIPEQGLVVERGPGPGGS